MSREVNILPTGAANLRSVQEALKPMADVVRLVESAEEIESEVPLVVPGVGAFGPAMAGLRERGLIEPLRNRISSGLPTLCICLGMQLLLEGSEEAPGVDGLGIAEGMATRFPSEVRVPQMGWNDVGGIYYYFANSFRLESPPPGWECGMADYAGPFVTMMRRAKVLACQFHPELSGKAGIGLIQEWMDAR